MKHSASTFSFCCWRMKCKHMNHHRCSVSGIAMLSMKICLGLLLDCAGGRVHSFHGIGWLWETNKLLQDGVDSPPAVLHISPFWIVVSFVDQFSRSSTSILFLEAGHFFLKGFNLPFQGRWIFLTVHFANGGGAVNCESTLSIMIGCL